MRHGTSNGDYAMSLDDWLSERPVLVTHVTNALKRLDTQKLVGTEYAAPAQRVDSLVAAANEDPARGAELRSVAVAVLLRRMVVGEGFLRLPEWVTFWRTREMSKLEHFIVAHAITEYSSHSSDSFIKDVRYVLGMSIPCGAQSVEIDDRLRLRSLIKHALTTGQLAPLRMLGQSAIRGGWFGIHTDSRDLSFFSEAGWKECYTRIAELLKLNPSVEGIVGSSWFFDPQLVSISPRLAYLQEIPLKNGAVAIRNGPGAIHTSRATATSRSRRELYETGKYLPVCYTVAWPRQAVIRWAGV